MLALRPPFFQTCALRPPTHWLLHVAMLTAAAGCAPGPASTLTGSAGPAIGDAFLIVSNRHPHDIDVGFRTEFQFETRLGTVRVHSRNDLTLPRTLNGTYVEVLVTCKRTGETYATRRIVWGPQQRFALLVPQILALSKLTRS